MGIRKHNPDSGKSESEQQTLTKIRMVLAQKSAIYDFQMNDKYRNDKERNAYVFCKLMVTKTEIAFSMSLDQGNIKYEQDLLEKLGEKLGISCNQVYNSEVKEAVRGFIGKDSNIYQSINYIY